MERSAIVDECIALIAPDAQHETECRRQVEAMITLLWRVKAPKIEPPPEKRRARLIKKVTGGGKADREALLRLADALADAAAQLPHCGWVLDLQALQLPDFDAALPSTFRADEFSKQLETLVTVAREAANSMQVKGGRPLDGHKYVVAGWAKHLIEDHGTKPPTLTIGGPYYELASVLYRVRSGEREADLSRYCKLVARGTKGRNKQL